jgi:acetyl esterase
MIEDLQRRSLAALMSLPRPLLTLLAGRPVRVDGQALDLQTQFLLKLFGLLRIPGFENQSVADARHLISSTGGLLAGPPRSLAKVEGRRINGPAGAIPLRIYTPRVPARALPVVVYFHGGGWVIGDLESHDRPLRMLADETAAIVVAVDYRLAPEHPFPAAFEDAVTAARWVFAHAADIGADPSRLALAGDSAGGNLAAAVAQALRGGDHPAPVLQWLIYPVTDALEESASYQRFSEGYYLTRTGMRWFKDHYLGRSGEGRDDPRASPLRATSLEGLPPAFVQTAGFDPLRDEGRAYAERLLEAGVDVDYRNYPGLIHGFFSMGGVIEAARAATEEGFAVLRRAFDPEL